MNIFEVLELDSVKLSSKKEKEFIFTALILNDFQISNKQIFIYHLAKLNKYQVFIYKEKSKIIVADLFKTFYSDKSNKNTIDLFLNDEFLALYKNQKFYYFQKLNTKLNDFELKEYIKNKFFFELDNIYYINEEEYLKLKESYISKKISSSFTNINKSQFNSFFVFIAFLITLVFLSTFYFYKQKDSYEIKKNEALINAQKSHLLENAKLKYKYLNPILQNLFLQLNKLNLKAQKVELKNDEIFLEIYTKDKKNIYTFLSKNNKMIVSSTIFFDEVKKLFGVQINAKVIRK